MNRLTRALLVGLLVFSCGEDITGPEMDDCPFPERINLQPDSLHLVMGSADGVRATRGCYDQSLQSSVVWTLRDTTIAGFGTSSTYPVYPDASARIIEPRAPGRTFLVMEADGITDSLAISIPDTVVLSPVRDVAAGGNFSCAVDEDEQAWCWGGGILFGTQSSGPAIGTCWGTPCSPVPVLRGTGMTSVAAGDSHACALDASGAAWCWGDNTLGTLGVSGSSSSAAPVPVSGGRTFTALTAGAHHSCGLTANGEAYCWGGSSTGEVGQGRFETSVYSPSLVVGGHRFVSLGAMDAATCGATDEGHLYCWGTLGDNSFTVPGAQSCAFSGKGGSVTVACTPTPLRMPISSGSTGDTLFVEVSGGCARTALGSVSCRASNQATYVAKSGLGAMVAISGSSQHACGLTETGSALCWGVNEEGQLGDGTRSYRIQPVPVAGGHTFRTISAGSQHTCGLTTEDKVWCWGAGSYGQAGRSILVPALTPEKVRGQG